MPQNRIQAQITFLITIAVFWVFSDFFTHLKIHIIIGSIIILLYNVPRATLLWEVLAVGVVLDSLEASQRLGFLAASYLVATLFSWRCRMYFFKDSPVTLPIMTSIFSFIMTQSLVFETFLLDIPAPQYTFAWFMTDCIFMPLLDGISAYLLFDVIPSIARAYFTRFRHHRRST